MDWRSDARLDQGKRCVILEAVVGEVGLFFFSIQPACVLSFVTCNRRCGGCPCQCSY